MIVFILGHYSLFVIPETSYSHKQYHPDQKQVATLYVESDFGPILDIGINCFLTFFASC